MLHSAAPRPRESEQERERNGNQVTSNGSRYTACYTQAIDFAGKTPKVTELQDFASLQARAGAHARACEGACYSVTCYFPVYNGQKDRDFNGLQIGHKLRFCNNLVTQAPLIVAATG